MSSLFSAEFLYSPCVHPLGSSERLPEIQEEILAAWRKIKDRSNSVWRDKGASSYGVANIHEYALFKAKILEGLKEGRKEFFFMYIGAGDFRFHFETLFLKLKYHYVYLHFHFYMLFWKLKLTFCRFSLPRRTS